MLNVGEMAPDFTLKDQFDTEVTLSSFRGKVVVLFWYPKADTPGCTVEACSFRDGKSKFDEAGIVQFGLSPDTPKKQGAFAKKFDLPMQLLGDTEHQTAEAYGVWIEKSMYGKKYMGIDRTTFVIGKDGTISHIFRKVKVDNHAEEVLNAILGGSLDVARNHQGERNKMTSTREFDVVTFGETMLRLSAPGYSRLEETDSLDLRIGGSESNTAVALKRLGLKVNWWSKLPDHPLGRRIENEIRRWGVDTSGTIWDDSPEARAGLYFLDFGVPPRGIDVYYDRAHSSASKITAQEIDESRIGSSRLLHVTGITPALSPYAAKATVRAIEIAKSNDSLVTFDINYRAKLWSASAARQTLEPLFSKIDLLLTPLEDAERLFGITGDGASVAKEFRERYEIETVVVTCGGDGVFAKDSKGEYSAKPFPLKHVVDRVGAGDAFNAGLIMGYLESDLQKGLEFGMTMAALKHTMPGDLLLSTRAEIEAAMKGGLASISR